MVSDGGKAPCDYSHGGRGHFPVTGSTNTCCVNEDRRIRLSVREQSGGGVRGSHVLFPLGTHAEHIYRKLGV